MNFQQPASFTDPPYGPDQPDSLPTHCPDCNAPLGDWEAELTSERVEVDGRNFTEHSVDWWQRCQCGYLIVVRV